MKELKCLVIDDEELARTLLINYLERIPKVTTIASCSNPMEAFEIIDNQYIDLIFLDIQMPDLTGIEFLKTLKNPPQIIFTTAYSDYALEGYELDIIDYLLKPFSFERFVQAINKARNRSESQTDIFDSNRNKIWESKNRDYLLVKSEHKLIRIYFREINYIQSMREYVAYFTDTEKILSLGSLKKLEEELPQDLFARIHKSYIVSKDKVKAMEGNTIHISDEKLPIGASYRGGILKALFEK